ncbi:hypothetical protein PR202_gb19841 [Eleusine coracana subsp. coracana]|uniref:Uncharacterized protein n=1 Tax=Eleusine coracana subsp. coracana TaxID=191504 RepID=A0AAV5FB19_ELECO|nr:hypothetical protein PR202_gb19841 [Eleusine coracana subsp. coracana]
MFSPEFVSSKSLPSWPILSAGTSVTVSLVLSLFLIFEHLCAYHQPEEQKFLIGLILMVPVYAVQSFFSLLNSNVAFICELMRDCYEAFAMYCFERYLIACLGGEESTIRFMEGQLDINESSPLLDVDYDYGIVKHPFPLNCFMRNWYLGPDFYNAVKIGIVQYMGVAAVVHLKVFPAKPYRCGERSVPNVAVMSDYASLGAPDPEEDSGIDSFTILRTPPRDAKDRRLSFPQSVRDVVLGSSEIMADDVRYTVSHVVEPMERSFTKINQTIHQISENVKQLERQKRKAKDDSHLIPLEPWSEEFSEAHDHAAGGSCSDSGLAKTRYNRNSKRSSSSRKSFEFRLGRCF